MKYRKKPVEVEAMQIKEILYLKEKDWFSLPSWVADSFYKGKLFFKADEIIIETLEGNMVGRENDFLIKGIKDEIYPCAQEIFFETYDEV